MGAMASVSINNSFIQSSSKLKSGSTEYCKSKIFLVKTFPIFHGYGKWIVLYHPLQTSTSYRTEQMQGIMQKHFIAQEEHVYRWRRTRFVLETNTFGIVDKLV